MPDLITERLSARQVRLAFPLMREVVPTLTLDDWLRYARRVVSDQDAPTRGVLVVRRRDLPHLSGAVCYRYGRDLHLGMILTAENFVALDLLHPRVVLAALVAALEATAARLGCNAIRSVVQGTWPHLADDLRACGHMADGIVMARTLPPPTART